MKTKRQKIAPFALLLAILAVSSSLLCVSCDFFADSSEDGSLIVRIDGYDAISRALCASSGGIHATAARYEIPDTSDFLLTVTDADGKTVYDGTYGDSPLELFVAPGSYMVSIRSSDFERPAFSEPLFGDDRCVDITAGAATEVRLECTMLNSGVKVSFSDEFRASYPSAALSLSVREGRLPVDYSESRVAYFRPGTVSLLMDDGSGTRSLFSRRIEARNILRVNVTAPQPEASGSGGGISVGIDTTAFWSDLYVDVGNDMAGGSSMEDAMDVAAARMNAPEKGVWVYGYIVGCFKSSSNLVSAAPYPSSTNIAISPRPSSADIPSCLSVELKKGAVRDVLNLQGNPQLAGKKVFLKGDLVESYFGVPGLKNVTEYEVK